MARFLDIRPRLSFGNIKEVAELPELVALQKKSYDDFLQRGADPDHREVKGLQEVCQNFFPVTDLSGKSQLEFVRYVLEEPKYDEQEARQRGGTFSAAVRMTFRLVSWEVSEDSGSRTISSVKEQDVYMGDIPLMTEKATFVINGVERVVVSQMHRSPGVFFDHDKGRSHASGKFLFLGSVRPIRGSWLDVEFDVKDLLYARIDRKRKFLATTLLMALPSSLDLEDFGSQEGMSRSQILNTFYDSLTCFLGKEDDDLSMELSPDLWRGVRTLFPLVDAETGEELVAKDKKIVGSLARKLQAMKDVRIRVPLDELLGRYVAEDVIDQKTGEVIAEAGDEVNKALVDKMREIELASFRVLKIDHVNIGSYLRDTLVAERHNSRQDALFEIYRFLRPGDPPTFDSAVELFRGLFFDAERYDLSSVGRMKMSARLKTDAPADRMALCPEDIVGIIRVMLNLRDGREMTDDIDSLSNRRVRAVGEMLAAQYQSGLLRLERSIKERMNNTEEEVTPQNVLNAKPLTASLRDFFGSSQLSQFMDQTNPLAEITHKRRLSALGPGGLAKDRASLEVRDVHPTHYGRVCPVETPEGQSIGLINSMACYARVNAYGFIETAYARVREGRVTDEVVYLSALHEAAYAIAQGNALRSEDGTLTEDLVSCRKDGEYVLLSPQEVDFMDVSPKQVLSVAASLIPFVENDDASRALMGANMQRQAVPLLNPEAPLVGTGMERVVARDSGSGVLARRSGVVNYVDGTRIVVLADSTETALSVDALEEAKAGHKKAKDKGAASGVSAGGQVAESLVDIYTLLKFQKTNHGTCMNQRPLVREGQHVEAGQVIADGSSSDCGELALGRNITVAFMPWHGYGFEDSIAVSERLIENDAYTSIHIEEFEVSARDTKLGSEEITRDISGVNEEMLSRLDESGIAYVGAEVKPGDILVGKVTPKGDNPMTAEEKLLRAIFGEKAMDMSDTSLRVPPGVRGTVVDVRVFSRRGLAKDERSIAIERTEIQRLMKARDLEKKTLELAATHRLRRVLEGEVLSQNVDQLKSGDVLTEGVLKEMPFSSLVVLKIANQAKKAEVSNLIERCDVHVKKAEAEFERKVERLRRGDDLPSGVLKTVRVFVAIKRKLQTGDKMAGRHGNKGVVSRVLPVEEMPYMADGTPVDMILNPLGVPSRMNVGQVFEVHLGWAAKAFGHKVRRYLEEHLGGVVDADAEIKADASTSTEINRDTGKKIEGDTGEEAQAYENFDFEALRSFLKSLYRESPDLIQLTKTIDMMDEEGLMTWGLSLMKGVPMMAPVFEGIKSSKIRDVLEEAGEDPSGQMTLYDGRTGEPFDRKVTVGVMYMMKLHHLVDEKIHARSVGPYSLITQQPLGGKAQFGGQRLGEMEVWALEGYGAAHTLREMLTIKSDDTVGRTDAYESVIRGDGRFTCRAPASFNVLVKELKALGLNVELLSEKELEEKTSKAS